MRVGSLFSGIGGLDLGLERAGMEVRWQCEIDPYCRSVLAHHWPGLRIYDDIRNIDESAERVDLVCGGFPCQPVSLAGKGLAQKDPRWLWPEFARVVGLLRPRYVLLENVPGLRSRGLGDVLEDLSALGYDAEWEGIPASAAGAPHQRDRVWIVAYPDDAGREEQLRPSATTTEHTASELRGAGLSPAVRSASTGSDSDGKRRRGGRVPEVEGQEVPDADGLRPRIFRGPIRPSREWASEPAVGRVADGVPGRVAQLRALGNAVVPQVAEFVGRLILEAEAKAVRAA